MCRQRFSILIKVFRLVVQNALSDELEQVHVSVKLSGQREVKDEAIVIRVEVVYLCVASEAGITIVLLIFLRCI